MAKVSSTEHLRNFKHGKLAPRRDRRNLKFAALLRAPVKLPKEYDFDLKHHGVPTPMFANDDLFDCVIAGRAHQTLRFELIEQKKLISIKDGDVKREYFKETDGEDSGLVVLDSLKVWRKSGWKVGKKTFRIEAFSQLRRDEHSEVKQAIVMDIGVGIGLDLPDSAMDQLDAGKTWEVVSGKRGKIGSYGGHYVFVPGYTTKGPVCVTWGQKQQMSWAFFDKYCDEAYAIIDAVNTTKIKRVLDSRMLAAFLSKHPVA